MPPNPKLSDIFAFDCPHPLKQFLPHWPVPNSMNMSRIFSPFSLCFSSPWNSIFSNIHSTPSFKCHLLSGGLPWQNLPPVSHTYPILLPLHSLLAYYIFYLFTFASVSFPRDLWFPWEKWLLCSLSYPRNTEHLIVGMFSSMKNESQELPN